MTRHFGISILFQCVCWGGNHSSPSLTLPPANQKLHMRKRLTTYLSVIMKTGDARYYLYFLPRIVTVNAPATQLGEHADYSITC